MNILTLMMMNMMMMRMLLMMMLTYIVMLIDLIRKLNAGVFTNEKNPPPPNVCGPVFWNFENCAFGQKVFMKDSVDLANPLSFFL